MKPVLEGVHTAVFVRHTCGESVAANVRVGLALLPRTAAPGGILDTSIGLIYVRARGRNQSTKEGCMRATAFVAAIAASLALSVPTASAEGCASTCSVGGAGTGGQSSDGQAQGFRLAGPSTGFPGSTFSNQGNEMAGHISVDGASNGSASGGFTPQGVVVGHYDGVVAIRFGMDGDCSGVCG